MQLVAPSGPACLQVGGISLEELNGLEMDMLARLDFRLFVSWDTIKHMLRQLQVRGGAGGREQGGGGAVPSRQLRSAERSAERRAECSAALHAAAS